jgi:hypothetical protein
MEQQKFTINSLESLIRFINSCTHEPHGKPAPRGVSGSHLITQKSLREQWKRQADANKAKKKRKRNV